MHIIVYECSSCKKRHYDSTNMKRHVKTKQCADAQLTPLPGKIILDDDHTPAPVRDSLRPAVRSRPGPKPFDITAAMQGRVPAYDDGDDDRIEALFEDRHALDELLKCESVSRIAPCLFGHLWGRRAPEHLRSIAKHRNSVYEVSGHGCVSDRGPTRRKYIRELVSYIQELARTILTISVPARYPEASERAEYLLEKLNVTCDGATLKDVLERSETYAKTRPPALTKLAGEIEGAMLTEFTREVWTPYD